VIEPQPGPPSDLAARTSIAGRYQLINQLGRGGMGLVYRGLDRLTGRVVTVKRLRLSGEPVQPPDGNASEDDRMLLAQEFRLLASLRHPNIVSVLDYGFDQERQPYFTMGLEENARTIIEAGGGEPLALQVDLLVQALRALAYLHRNGIIHCDLKPENILVVSDQVKVLDFGLSICKRLGEVGVGFWGGTPAYMAPELLQGRPPTEQSDLFALGVVAYELFSGGRPYRTAGRVSGAKGRQVLPADADLDPRLKPVLERLLATRPEERYRRASDVIAALASLLDLPLSLETIATRESFLQTAPLVGRDEEIAKLVGLLRRTAAGNGSAWMVGGESGVGKSRLLDEFTTRALIEPAVVVRGQALSQGGGPYHPWREILSNLVLRIELNAFEAGVLKAIVPTISSLLGRDVPDAPDLEPDAAQSRLLITVEEIARRQPEPVVVVLEDLQWAGSESLRLWSWLARAAGGLSLLLLGSYRSDDAPALPDAVDATQVLALRRLNGGEIASLGESLIGATVRRPALATLLERETEGIPFFIVEVVRALAESAGELALVGDSGLPSRVLSGGMQKLIRRHLSRAAAGDVPPLEAAAVIGRDVDPVLMQSLYENLALEPWSQRLAAAALLEFRDRQWRFAHDKLREQILADLSGARYRALHRQVADAIERTYPASVDHVTALAHHWREAGEETKEAEYVRLAGFLALRSGACREAITYFERALELTHAAANAAGASGVEPPRAASRRPGPARPLLALDPNKRVEPEEREFQLGTLEGGLTEAYYRLGDLKRCREHGELALAHLGQYVPGGRFAWAADTLRQGVVRCLQAVAKVRSRDTARARCVADEVGGVLLRVTEAFYFSLQAMPVVWSSLRLVNQCAPAGPSPILAQGYVMLAVLASAVPAPALAAGWCRRALSVAEQTASARDVASILSRTAVVHTAICQWDEANAALDRAARIAEEVGDMRLWAECVGQKGLLGFYSGRFETALTFWREAFRLGRRGGNQQIESWGLMCQGDILVRLGRNEEALPLYAEAIARMKDQETLRAESICLFGMCALAHLRAGDERAALAQAEAALVQILTIRPIVYFVQHGFAATAEVFLRLAERQARRGDPSVAMLEVRAQKALASLHRFSRRFPLGRPHAHLWQGLEDWSKGRSGRAVRHWRRSVELAQRLQTPYELGQAHFEMGRHATAGAEGDRHLRRALEVFEQLGSRTDVECVNEELARRELGRSGPG
jgi:serine/threonine protein kinase/tetratricopeptide (TPR) repeat protein